MLQLTKIGGATPTTIRPPINVPINTSKDERVIGKALKVKGTAAQIGNSSTGQNDLDTTA